MKRYDTIRMSLAWLAEQGWIAQRVERWNAYSGRKEDLFGFADIIAFNEQECALVQSFTRSTINRHVKAMQACENLTAWLKHPARKCYLHIWPKEKDKGRQMHVVEFTLENCWKLLNVRQRQLIAPY